MNSKKIFKGLAVIVSSTIFSMSTIQSAYAAPGPLATAPLYLSSIVEPNVFFTLDDSGSMEWTTMVRGSGYNGLASVNGRYRGYLHPSWYEQYKPAWNAWLSIDVLPPSENTGVAMYDDTWIFRTHHGNGLYYNPETKYEPWAGSKPDGNPMYDKATPTNVLRDPDAPTGASVNLEDDLDFWDRWGNKYDDDLYLPTYYDWVDDGDGVIESTDTHVLYEIEDGDYRYGIDQWQNFANWFQYYRSRMNATKAAIGRVINNTDATRMGLDVFNRGYKKASKTMTNPTYKYELLKEFYSTWDGGSTWSRTVMKRVGELFKSTTADGSGRLPPILDQTDGGECQQNFNIFMSDGFWNGGNPHVGNRDKNGGTNENDTIFDGNASVSNDGGNYADSYSNTLADVAMKYYEEDLSALADNVPTQEGIDENARQHLVTYAIAFGLSGTLDPSIEPTDIAPDPPFAGWPQPVADTSTAVDDLRHAAYNGRGEFLSAQSSAELEAALGAAIDDIAERTATAAAVAINSAKLTEDAVVYLAEFNTNRWQGDLIAKQIADTETGELESGWRWRAGDVLTNRDLTISDRTIITYDGSDGIPFQWTNLTAPLKADLNTDPTGVADGLGEERLNYLRGDRSQENKYRVRLSILGDLVNSGPVYVGKPDLNWPDNAPFPSTAGSRYSDFKNGTAASRPAVIFTGANDGMLHGFAESDGAEVLAYIPGSLYSASPSEGLHYLTDPNYQHQYYVDLTPTLSDVYADLGTGGDKWQTILVGGLRGGGRGIFALNVNDPNTYKEANASDIVLWEFSDADDPDIGFTFSKPEIALANNGRWVAIFSNGYNHAGPDGQAKLFIVDIAKGVDGWVTGDYKKISTNTGTVADPNGLSSPALVDTDGDGDVDRVYAGDLEGKLWAFDLSDTDWGNWKLASASPLFTTKGNRPITTQPTTAIHPTVSSDGSNAPNRMVYFGTGQYLVNNDKTTKDLNHFYGVWDRGDYGRSDGMLVQQTYLNGYNTWIDANGDAIQQPTELIPQRVLTRTPVDYAGVTKYGWMVELYSSVADSGERLVEPPVVRGNAVFFNTFIPNSDPCSFGSSGWGMALDLETGGSPLAPTTDVNGDGVIDDKDRAADASGNIEVVAGSKKEGYLPEPVFIEDISYTGETPTKVEKLKDIPTGRFSWQELLQ